MEFKNTPGDTAAALTKKECKEELFFLNSGGEMSLDLQEQISRKEGVSLVKLKLELAYGVVL